MRWIYKSAWRGDYSHFVLNFPRKYYTEHAYFAALAQLVEHPHGKGKVMGSCPIGGSIFTCFLRFFPIMHLLTSPEGDFKMVLTRTISSI